MFVPPPEQQRLLQECQALILQRQQYALRNPSDLQNQSQIVNLQQVSLEVKSILGGLRTYNCNFY